MIFVVYIVAVLLFLFALSGALPRYRQWNERLPRVQEFERHYRAWIAAESAVPDERALYYLSGDEDDNATKAAREAETLRAWLVARRNEMQRDAQVVGKGVMYIAPPPVIGGSYQPHHYFQDLFDDRTNSVGSTQVRLDDLATITHEVQWIADARRSDLYNPWTWVRSSFERLIGFPRYVLLRAGFGKAADSAAARTVTVVWSLVVGASGIGGFVVGLLALNR